MATKTKSTPKIQAEQQIEQISMIVISASKSNPRQSFENIKDLADSMASVGLLQPITLRAIGKASYEIVAGERRWRAAKLLKWETIPAIVREISDEEMLEIQIIENLQREDVSPLDEAHAFKTLLDKESLDWLSSKIHKPKKYILDRLKLNDLVPEAAELVQSGILPLGHAVVISKLSFADQKACLDLCIRKQHDGYNDETDESIYVTSCVKTLEELKRHISGTIMLDFYKSPFDKNDETLYPDAGSCASCPKRTCNSNLLFQDITSDDKCTDASCFQEKIKLHVEREKAKAKEAHGTVLAGERPTYNSHTHVKVQGVEVPIQKTPTKNSIPVVITKVDRYGGHQHLGETVYVDKMKVEQVKAEKAEGPKKRNGLMSYEDERKKEFTEVIWPRLEMIVALMNKPVPKEIVTEFFRYRFDSYRASQRMLSIAGILGYNGFTATPEKALADEDNDFDFKKEMIDKVIRNFSTEQLIVMSMLLDRVDDDDDAEIDENEFGMTWNQMMELFEPKKKGVKSLIK